MPEKTYYWLIEVVCGECKRDIVTLAVGVTPNKPDGAKIENCDFRAVCIDCYPKLRESMQEDLSFFGVRSEGSKSSEP